MPLLCVKTCVLTHEGFGVDSVGGRCGQPLPRPRRTRGCSSRGNLSATLCALRSRELREALAARAQSIADSSDASQATQRALTTHRASRNRISKQVSWASIARRVRVRIRVREGNSGSRLRDGPIKLTNEPPGVHKQLQTLCLACSKVLWDIPIALEFFFIFIFF